MAKSYLGAGREVSRRGFLSAAIGAVGGLIAFVVAIPGISYFISPAVKAKLQEKWVPLGPVDVLKPGEPRPFQYVRKIQDGWVKSSSTEVAFVLEKEDGTISAFSNVCTHLNCRVTWHEDIQQFVCPCHGAHFDRDGNVLSGPPPRPLDHFDNKVESGQVYIKIEE